jgi:hypothetical protein
VVVDELSFEVIIHHKEVVVVGVVVVEIDLDNDNVQNVDVFFSLNVIDVFLQNFFVLQYQLYHLEMFHHQQYFQLFEIVVLDHFYFLLLLV